MLLNLNYCILANRKLQYLKIDDTWRSLLSINIVDRQTLTKRWETHFSYRIFLLLLKLSMFLSSPFSSLSIIYVFWFDSRRKTYQLEFTSFFIPFRRGILFYLSTYYHFLRTVKYIDLFSFVFHERLAAIERNPNEEKCDSRNRR